MKNRSLDPIANAYANTPRRQSNGSGARQMKDAAGAQGRHSVRERGSERKQYAERKARERGGGVNACAMCGHPVFLPA